MKTAIFGQPDSVRQECPCSCSITGMRFEPMVEPWLCERLCDVYFDVYGTQLKQLE